MNSQWYLPALIPCETSTSVNLGSECKYPGLFSPWQFPHGSPQQIQWCVSATNTSSNIQKSRSSQIAARLGNGQTHTQLVKWKFLQISRKSQLSECHWNHLRLLELLGCFDFLQTAFPSMLDPFMTGRRTGCVWKLRNCNFWEGNLWAFNVEKFGDTSNKRPICWTKKQVENLQGWESKRESGMTMKTPYSCRGPFHLVAVFLGTNFGLKKPWC